MYCRAFRFAIMHEWKLVMGVKLSVYKTILNMKCNLEPGKMGYFLYHQHSSFNSNQNSSMAHREEKWHFIYNIFRCYSQLIMSSLRFNPVWIFAFHLFCTVSVCTVILHPKITITVSKKRIENTSKVCVHSR